MSLTVVRNRAKASDPMIIFVHGIFSDAHGCWRNKEGVSWPSLVASDPSFTSCGICTVSYKTSLTGGTYSVSDAANLVWQELKHYGIFTDNSKTVVFVCHSMGGLVVRRLIVQRRSNFSRETLIGVLLVASPSLGARWAWVLKPFAVIARNAQALALGLSEDNKWLVDLADDFKKLVAEKAPVVVGQELVEDKPWPFGWLPWLPRIVRKIESAVFFADSLVIPDSNHITIAKPRSIRSPQHMALSEFTMNVVAMSSQLTFVVTEGASFEHAATTIGRIDQLYVEFKNFHQAELDARCGIETKLEGVDAEGVLGGLSKAFSASAIRPYSVVRSETTVTLTVL